MLISEMVALNVSSAIRRNPCKVSIVALDSTKPAAKENATSENISARLKRMKDLLRKLEERGTMYDKVLKQAVALFSSTEIIAGTPTKKLPKKNGKVQGKELNALQVILEQTQFLQNLQADINRAQEMVKRIELEFGNNKHTKDIKRSFETMVSDNLHRLTKVKQLLSKYADKHAPSDMWDSDTLGDDVLNRLRFEATTWNKEQNLKGSKTMRVSANEEYYWTEVVKGGTIVFVRWIPMDNVPRKTADLAPSRMWVALIQKLGKPTVDARGRLKGNLSELYMTFSPKPVERAESLLSGPRVYKIKSKKDINNALQNLAFANDLAIWLPKTALDREKMTRLAESGKLRLLTAKNVIKDEETGNIKVSVPWEQVKSVYAELPDFEHAVFGRAMSPEHLHLLGSDVMADTKKIMGVKDTRLRPVIKRGANPISGGGLTPVITDKRIVWEFQVLPKEPEKEVVFEEGKKNRQPAPILDEPDTPWAKSDSLLDQLNLDLSDYV